MEFSFRKAELKDVQNIMKIMNEAVQNMEHPQWFVSDDEDYIRTHLEGDHFIIVAEAGEELAGFFAIKKPLPKENLGQYLAFTKKQCEKVWIMDSAAVAQKYRGNHLQESMLLAAEKEVKKYSPKYLMCTVHPDNRYSLHNMVKNGYRIMKQIKCYGGLDRYVLLKENL